VRDEHRILTTSSVVGNVAMSLPRIIGSTGVIATLTPTLDDTERKLLKESEKITKTNYSHL